MLSTLVGHSLYLSFLHCKVDIKILALPESLKWGKSASYAAVENVWSIIWVVMVTR